MLRFRSIYLLPSCSSHNGDSVDIQLLCDWHNGWIEYPPKKTNWFNAFWCRNSFLLVRSSYTITRGRPSQVRKTLFLNNGENHTRIMANYCAFFCSCFIKFSFLDYVGLRVNNVLIKGLRWYASQLSQSMACSGTMTCSVSLTVMIRHH